jgi:DNA polymerase-4
MSKLDGRIELPFNPARPAVMHIDLNSCFASVEQQANPLLRGQPVAVAAYAKEYGCILAPSVEAKLYGIKTGMTVKEGRMLCPFLIVREPDPPKYRIVHHAIGQLLSEYCPDVTSKSIDEFALRFDHMPGVDPHSIVREVKKRIQAEIGDYLRVSVGLSTNWILAKLGSGLHKPDGFDVIDMSNYRQVLDSVTLQDFCGINVRNEARLHRAGVYTGREFYEASVQQLRVAFESVLARYWYIRLRGYEIDDVEFARRSYGQSYVLPYPMEEEEWRPILAKLVDKGTRRMRAAGYKSRGIMLAVRYGDHSGWHMSKKGNELLGSASDIFVRTLDLYHRHAPALPVKKIAFSCFELERDKGQLSCLRNLVREGELIDAVDRANDRWGDYTVTYASSLGSRGYVRDSIAFGK